MIITIYSLDADYRDAVLEMGGVVVEHSHGGVIDVEFNTNDGIGLVTMSSNDCIGFTSEHDVGIVVQHNEFLAIKID